MVRFKPVLLAGLAALGCAGYTVYSSGSLSDPFLVLGLLMLGAGLLLLWRVADITIPVGGVER